MKRTKVKLKEFVTLDSCEKYINEFSKKKKVSRKEVLPIQDKQAKYAAFLEYTD